MGTTIRLGSSSDNACRRCLPKSSTDSQRQAGIPNDSAIITVQYANGAVGAVQTTRLATGHVNSLLLSIHGEKGAFRLDLDASPDVYEECFVQKKDGKTSPWTKVAARPVPTLQIAEAVPA